MDEIHNICCLILTLKEKNCLKKLTFDYIAEVELEQAEAEIIKCSQRAAFKEQLHCITTSKMLKRSSFLFELSPIYCEIVL